MTKKLISLTLAASVAAIGCLPIEDAGDTPLPMDGKSASALANKLIGEHLDGLANALRVLDRSKFLSETSDAPESECPPDESGQPPSACDDPEEEGRFDLTAQTDEIKKWLSDNVFNEAAIESTTETSVTYRVSADVACPQEEDETGALSRDEDCIKVFTEMPVRLVVTSTTGDDLDIDVKIGSHAPGSIELYTVRVSTRIDLAVAKTVISEIATLTGEDASDLPERLAGVAKIALVKNAQDDYTGSLAILEAVTVGVKDATNRKYVNIKAGVAPNAVSVRLSAEKGLVDGSFAFGSLDISTALDLFGGDDEEDCDTNEETGDWECTTTPRDPLDGVLNLVLKGLTGSGSFDVDADKLTLTGLGLGNDKAVLKFDGEQALSVSVNADTNGLVDLALTSLADGWEANIAQHLQLAVEHSLGALADALGEAGDEIPAWAKSGQSSIVAEGEPNFVLRFFEAPEPPICERDAGECPEGESSKQQIKEGTLTLSADGIDNVVIEAPECIVGSDEGDDDAHIFTALTGGSCE